MSHRHTHTRFPLPGCTIGTHVAHSRRCRAQMVLNSPFFSAQMSPSMDGSQSMDGLSDTAAAAAAQGVVKERALGAAVTRKTRGQKSNSAPVIELHGAKIGVDVDTVEIGSEFKNKTNGCFHCCCWECGIYRACVLAHRHRHRPPHSWRTTRRPAIYNSAVRQRS